MSRRIIENERPDARDHPRISQGLNVLQDGPLDAPAVLLLHGLAGSTAWWEPVVPMLARNFRVIRVDLQGHGRSPSPRDGYDTASHARRVAEALDKLRVGRCRVVGHSTGGLVATALGEQRPDAVVAFTVIDTCPSPNPIIPQGLLSRLALRPIPGALLWRLQTDATIRKLLRAGAFYREVDIPPDIIESIRGMTHRAFAKTASGSLEYVRLRGVPDRLGALGVPTQVIFGVEDRRYRSASSIDEYRVIPDVHTELIKGVGHTPMLEDPRTTGRLLSDFLTRNARSDS
jgi:pimeloyl-ACP methyl ester carboxylesterase